MKELKNKTLIELKKLISEKRDILRDFRFGNVNNKSKNVKLANTLKKDIARIMTELSIRSKIK